MYLSSQNYVYILLLSSFIASCIAFNLDTYNYLRYEGDGDSMFGFSVAAHRDRDYNWVLIGAPQADSSQPGVSRGGAVYYCPADRDGGCRQLPFDRAGNYNTSTIGQVDEKSRQWFGATVNSGGPDKPIVACAPRYLWYTYRSGRRDPVGTCYLSSSDFRDVREFSPCRTKNWGYHRQGTCQAGLSAAVSKDGERLFIGAPGSWYWQGQMYSIDPKLKLPYTPSRFSEYGSSLGPSYSQNSKQQPSVIYTKEGHSIDDDSYLGYSVTVGNFTGDKFDGIAAGMPRGSKLYGKVVLYSWNLINYENITGTQLGAYFGYSVAAADLNGDGLDDLIVGAPLHTEQNNEGKYEVGRIYVIYSSRVRNTKRVPLHIDGVNSKGRFGLSVTSLGDIDLDGYEDIAVGAPYDGPNGRGAVYIYYGSKNGIRKKVSQVIHAEDVSASALYTFGFSVSGSGIDLDNNQYPDLVVGAYLSNTAFVFKSRPVINMESYIKFNTPHNTIGLDEKNCTIYGNRQVPCTSIQACVKYNGVGVANDINLIMEFTLDSKKPKDPRMFLYGADRQQKINETWQLIKNDLKCKTIQVFIKENTRDKLTPLEVQMKYYLPETKYSASHLRDSHYPLQSVLNANLPSVFKDSITIRKNCGSDDVCIPNLRLHVTPNVDKYLLGSGKKLEVDVIVKNEGEDSFESMFYMMLPPGINFFNTERLPGSLEIPIKCSPPSESTNNTLKCDIGNPLPQNKLVHFKVKLDPFNLEGMKPNYNFLMKVNSTNPENNSTISDNVKSLKIDIWVKTNLSLTGWALSPDVHYNENQYKKENYTSETDIGPQIVHIYGIKNNGPADINEAEVIFLWPSATLGGEDLLYLMEQPETSGPIKCERVPNANYLNVDLLPQKYYLESGSKIHAAKINSEHKFTTNVDSSGSRHEHKYETDEKLEETGDASLIHLNRGRERVYGNDNNNSGYITHTNTVIIPDRTTNASSSSSSSRTFTSGSSSGGTYTSGSSSSSGGIYTSGSSSSGGSMSGSSSGGASISGSSSGGASISGSSSGGASMPGSSSSGASMSGSGTSTFGSSSGRVSNTGSNFGRPTFTRVTDASDLGQNNNEFKIYYTSSGNQHENQLTNINYGNKVMSSSERTLAGQTHSTNQGKEHGQRWESGYFDWDKNNSSMHTNYEHGQNAHRGSNSFATDEYNRKYYGQTGDKHIFTANDFNQNGETVYNYFYRISGYDLRGLISESDLIRMLNTGNGEFFNGTHRITWSTDIHRTTKLSKPYDVSTEESINESLDQYTKNVTNTEIYHHRVDPNYSGSRTSTSYHRESSMSNVNDPNFQNRQFHENRHYGGFSSNAHNTEQSSTRVYIGDNVHTEHPPDMDYRNRIYRNKRQAETDFSKIIECKSTKCSFIKCTAGPLLKDEEAWTALRFRVNSATMKQIGWTETVTLSTMMISRINKLPYIGVPNDRPIHTHEIFTNVTLTETEIKPDFVPLWVVVLSACAGAIILLLLVYLLYKCGFFKRNRPSDAPEKQPLNRNGHYQGDEQL